MIAGTACVGGCGAIKTKILQVKCIDEDIDRAHWVIFFYPVVEALRKQ